MNNAKKGLIGAAVLATSVLAGHAASAQTPKPQPVKSRVEPARADKFMAEHAERAAWLEGMRAHLTPAEKAHHAARQTHASERASSHPAINRTAFYRGYHKHTLAVLDELEDVDLALSKLAPLEMLQKLRPDEISLTERGNLLMYMLTAFHEERGQGAEGMAAVTQVLKNRVKKEFSKAETPLAQLSLLAQFTYIGTTPLGKLLDGDNEPAMQKLAFGVAYAQVKNPEMAFTKGFLTEQQAARVDEVSTALQGCLHYHTQAAERGNGRAFNHLSNGGQVAYIGRHVYLLPDDKGRYPTR